MNITVRTCLKVWFVLLLCVVACYYYVFTNDYTKDKPYPGTIVAMSNIESGGKYSHSRPTLGIKQDDGGLYDCVTSVAGYSQWHVGDRIVIHRTDMEYKSKWYLTILDLLTHLGMVIGTLALLVFGGIIIHEAITNETNQTS